MSKQQAKEYFQINGGFTAEGLEIEWKLFVADMEVETFKKSEIMSWLGY
jgi:hypothetical protein